MLNNAEQEILALFLRSPSESYTVYSIAKRLGMYISQAQKAVQDLSRNKILSVKRMGARTSRCVINFSTADVDALAYSSLNAKKMFLGKNLKIRLATEQIEKKLAGEPYIMLLFGSHAKGGQRKGSDMDLCLIIQNEGDIESMKSKARAALSGFSYKVHLNVFTANWFYEMMKQRDTVGREIFKSSIVLHGHDLYYSLVKRYDQETGYSEGYTAL